MNNMDLKAEVIIATQPTSAERKLLPQTERSIWVGEERRFCVRWWLEEVDRDLWQGGLSSVREVGGGPELIDLAPPDYRKRLLGPSFLRASSALSSLAAGFVEVYAPPHF